MVLVAEVPAALDLPLGYLQAEMSVSAGSPYYQHVAHDCHEAQNVGQW